MVETQANPNCGRSRPVIFLEPPSPLARSLGRPQPGHGLVGDTQRLKLIETGTELYFVSSLVKWFMPRILYMLCNHENGSYHLLGVLARKAEIIETGTELYFVSSLVKWFMPRILYMLCNHENGSYHLLGVLAGTKN
ncbi:hypothetical protein J6590_059394 [Homalodisca vitripennis]|nr:hypothetical protein J6590_059394 [Homalodisca vitripennis]